MRQSHTWMLGIEPSFGCPVGLSKIEQRRNEAGFPVSGPGMGRDPLFLAHPEWVGGAHICLGHRPKGLSRWWRWARAPPTGLRLLRWGRGPPEGTEGLSTCSWSPVAWFHVRRPALLRPRPPFPSGKAAPSPCPPIRALAGKHPAQTLGVLAEKGQKVSGNRRSIVEAGLAPTPAQEAVPAPLGLSPGPSLCEGCWGPAGAPCGWAGGRSCRGLTCAWFSALWPFDHN